MGKSKKENPQGKNDKGTKLNNTKDLNKPRHSNFNKDQKPKFTNREILAENSFKASRDSEWFKRTLEKLETAKNDLDQKFLSEEKRAQKLDFIHRLRTKLKDYKDALKNEQKYRKIRFFERKKLERELKRVKKQAEEEPDTEKKLQLTNRKKELEDNITYVKVKSNLK